MSNHKQMKQNGNYQVKQRYIPTFVHQPFFYEQPQRPCTSRYTPTFHSTVFDTEGYNIKTLHEKRQSPVRPLVTNQNIIQSIEQNQSRVENVIPRNLLMSASTDKWFGHTKQRMFLTIKESQNHGYSKERKYVDLSSDPVFTDYDYGEKIAGNIYTESTHYGKKNGYIQHQGIVHQQNNQKQVKAIMPSDDVKQFLPTQSQQNTTLLPQKKKENLSLKHLTPKASKVPTINKNSKSQKQQLKLKGKQIASRPQTVQKSRTIQQKPTFTVIRKNRAHQ